jgi:predicted transcriptional regulator
VSTRAEILGFITNNPGSYLRDVSEEMGLAIGDVQYHLWILIKNGEIIDRRDGRYRRFFESGKYSEMEQKVISTLRQDTAGRILIRLAGEQSVSHMQLANMLGLTSQAVTWQMGRLRLTGLVEVIPGSEGKSYRLADCARESVERHTKAGQIRASPSVQRQTMATGITNVESPFTRALFWSF